MDKVRAWWFARQRLDRRRGASVRETVQRCGWLRSVGSANPYLAVWARTGIGRKEIEAAVAKTELVELPSAKSCTYYLPVEDAAIALKVAGMTAGQTDSRNAEKWFGYTSADIDRLCDSILKQLQEGPKDTRDLGKLLKDQIVNFGDEGKKRGMTTSLPLSLGRLQLQGRIRRLPLEGRLDTERYRYTIWENGPCPHELDEEEAAIGMADRYFRWAGPATEGEFRTFTGLTAKLSKAAVASLGLVACPGRADAYLHPDEAEEYARFDDRSDRVTLVACLDPWLHLRRNIASLLTHDHETLSVPYGKSIVALGHLQDLDSHPIVRGGRVVGMWEFDHARQEVAAWCFDGMDDATKRAVEETGSWIRDELGDFRSYSLDSPKSREPRVEQLRKISAQTVAL